MLVGGAFCWVFGEVAIIKVGSEVKCVLLILSFGDVTN